MRIFKVTFTDGYDYITVFKKMQTFDSFFYTNGEYFICTPKTERAIKRLPYLNTFKEITKDNYILINNSTAQNWCKEKFISFELSEFERSEEGQAAIREFIRYTDFLANGEKEVESFDKKEE